MTGLDLAARDVIDALDSFYRHKVVEVTATGHSVGARR